MSNTYLPYCFDCDRKVATVHGNGDKAIDRHRASGHDADWVEEGELQ